MGNKDVVEGAVVFVAFRTLYLFCVGISALHFNRSVGNRPLSRLDNFLCAYFCFDRSVSDLVWKSGIDGKEEKLHPTKLCLTFYDFILDPSIGKLGLISRYRSKPARASSSLRNLYRHRGISPCSRAERPQARYPRTALGLVTGCMLNTPPSVKTVLGA